MRFNIEGIDFLFVKELNIDRKINEHSFCEISLVVKDEFPQLINKYKPLISQSFSLQAIDELENERKTIFSGYIENIKFSKYFAKNIITLECFSNSKQEDKISYTYIFQNTEKTLGDILKQIKFVSVSPVFLEDNIENIKLSNPVVQNTETNFNFIKKLLFENKKILINESLLSNQKMWIGKREGNSFKIDENSIEIDFIESDKKVKVALINKFYEIGDILEIFSKKYYIIENNIAYKDGVCYCTYHLIDDYNNLEIENQNSLDKIFLGEVIENKDKDFLGRIQVKFKEDNYIKGKDDLYWFKILVPYSTKDTGLFLTPSKGDNVLIKFIDNSEPFILGSIRKNGHENFENPNNLFLKNDFGKEINLKEKEINIISIFDNIFLSLDEEKIEINNGETGLYIEKEKITFQNKNNIITIGDGIHIKKADGGEITIDENIQIKSKSSQLEVKDTISLKANNSFKVEANNIEIK